MIINIQNEVFNSKQSCEITGITSRQLIHWDEKGLVKPSVRSASGKGSQRLYSYTDLLALKVVKAMRDQDISLQKIRKCVRYLRRHLPDVSHPLTHCILVTINQNIYLLKDARTLVDTIKNPGQMAFTQLSIEALDRELRRKVLELKNKRVQEVIVGDFAYQVVIEPDTESGGFVAEVAGMPGCITQGDTLEETLEMARDAIKSYLEAAEMLKARGVVFPIRRQKARRKVRA